MSTTLHDGCFVCGSTKQAILKSKTLGALDLKGLGKTISAALCNDCFAVTDTVDLRNTKGKA